MAFVAEDGSGLSNSNGFITEAFFVSYHTDRNRSLVDPETDAQYTTTEITGAIVVVSDYLEAKFSFIGARKLSTQAMDWPRINACYSDGRLILGVPIELQECTAELVLKVLQGVELAPDPVYDDTLAPIKRRRERVGPIEEDIEFGGDGARAVFKAFPFAERKLKELIVNGAFLQRV